MTVEEFKKLPLGKMKKDLKRVKKLQADGQCLHHIPSVKDMEEIISEKELN